VYERLFRELRIRDGIPGYVGRRRFDRCLEANVVAIMVSTSRYGEARSIYVIITFLHSLQAIMETHRSGEVLK
jgi:hypothetical protein